MPAVQIAMSEFQNRGYARDPSSDGAKREGNSAMVGLGYSVPGHPEVGAVIFVASEMNGEVPATRVWEGLYEFDQASNEMVASSLMSSENHSGFEIEIQDMSKTNQGNYSFRKVAPLTIP